MADDDIGELFAAIDKLFETEDYEMALPLCSKATEMDSKNLTARKCRVFALLNLSRWSDALQVIDNAGSDKASLSFELAYCYYRLNRFQDALGAIGKAADDRSVRLEAQVRYRMGDYEASAKMYEKLWKEDKDDTGLLVNTLASRVSGDRPAEALAVMSGPNAELLDESYELCFNMACALIDEGRLSEAETRLQEAKQLCSSELQAAEDIPEEDAQILEDHEELAAIHTQRACVFQRRGMTDEANELYSRVLRQRGSDGGEVDVTVLAIACNNTIALRTEGKSLFDSLKRINIASKESLEHKLTRKQTIEIAINKCLLLLQARRLDEARRELQRLKENFPGHPRVIMVQSAISYAEKKTKVCEETLQGYLTEHPGDEDTLTALAQLYAQQRRFDRAVEVLCQLPVRRRSQPHTLQAIVSLHQKQKSPDKAVSCIRETIEFWTKSQASSDEESLGSVLRIAAQLALQLKDNAFAAEVFQLYLEKVDGTDVEALCGLVRALASTDIKKAEQYAQRLKVPDYDHLDAEELEQAPIPKIAHLSTKKISKGRPAKDAEDDTAATGEEVDSDEDAAAEGDVKRKKKKKKHIRLPKNFDPENPGPPPDPERWLPKRERTEYKKRMKKRDKHLQRGPQGTMPVDDVAFRKQGPSTAQVEVSSDNRSGKPRNQGRKKAAGKK